MTVLDRAAWEPRFRAFLASSGALGGDPAHDLSHLLRLVATAEAPASAEGAEPPSSSA